MAKEMKKKYLQDGRLKKKTRLIMAGFTPRATAAAAAVHPNVCPYIVLGYLAMVYRIGR